MILVGMSGTIGSGKTTFADYLGSMAEHSGHWESWQVIAEIANGLRTSSSKHPSPSDLDAINTWLRPLPELVQQVTHRTMPVDSPYLTKSLIAAHPERYVKLFEYLTLLESKPLLASGEVADQLKEQLRSLLQWLGGYLAKTVSGDIWYAEIVRRIKAVPQLDLATVGGVRFPADAEALIQAGGIIISIIRPSQKSQDSGDLTEREIGSVPFTAQVINDGTLDDLRACAQLVYNDILQEQIRPSYHAGEIAKH